MTSPHRSFTGSDRAPETAASEPSWVPADACRLPSGERPMRLDAFEELFAVAVRSLARPEPTRLRFELVPGPTVAARAAELAAREADCCGFFAFALTVAQGRLVLEATVPRNRTGVLDGLAAQAAAAGAPS